jgi:Domain of unknown function (DUF4920)
MKNTIALFLFLFTFMSAIAQPPSGSANKGDTYGEKINSDKSIPVAQLPALLQSKKEVATKIEGTVLDVCPKKGCWLSLALPNNETVFVRMKDYSFFVPTAMIGKTVVIEGEAKTKMTSVEDLKHYAEDAKKAKEEIDAIKEPKKEIQLMAKGIVVVK